MNLSSRVLLSSFLAAASAGALPAATPVIGAQLFQETNARIEELFRERDNPPKPPGPLDNPFRTNEAPVVSNPGVPHPTVPDQSTLTNPNESPDEALLRLAYGSLSFGGLIQVGDRQMVVINKATYKEGGLLTVRVQGTAVYLRIVSLSRESITLGLNEARLTLHF